VVAAPIAKTANTVYNVAKNAADSGKLIAQDSKKAIQNLTSRGGTNSLQTGYWGGNNSENVVSELTPLTVHSSAPELAPELAPAPTGNS